ncbi:uncharacterized protein [Clytia hemisphaerica]|uniref:uncharacterized protein isoform X2 n=1 Tax=Clytia hemisphaerica TaxID=252671 RepID=UPI0034D6C4D6
MTNSEMQTFTTSLPLSTSKTSIINHTSDEYDTLNHHQNNRSLSVESGIGLTNEAYEVFESEGNRGDSQISGAYTALDVHQPPTPINQDTRYEDLQRYEKMTRDGGHSGVSQPSKEHQIYSLPEFQQQTSDIKHKDRLYSLPEHNTDSNNEMSTNQRHQHSRTLPIGGHKKANVLYESNRSGSLDQNNYRQSPIPSSVGGSKKKNILYESTTMTETNHRIDRGLNKISITKQNSTSTRTICKNRNTVCGIPTKQCFMVLNVIFGVCAIVALIIGIFLVIHQQDGHEQSNVSNSNSQQNKGSSGTTSGPDNTQLNQMLNSLKDITSHLKKLDRTISTVNNTVGSLANKIPKDKYTNSKYASITTFKDCVYKRKRALNTDLKRDTPGAELFATVNAPVSLSSLSINNPIYRLTKRSLEHHVTVWHLPYNSR